MTADEYADCITAARAAQGSEIVLWASDGAWFIYTDEQGVQRNCHLGFCTNYKEMQDYAVENGIEFRQLQNRPSVRSTVMFGRVRSVRCAPLSRTERPFISAKK